MRIKLFLGFFLVLILTGCGITSRETTAETTPKNSTKIYALTDKGISISNSNGAKWDAVIQKSKTNNIPSSVINDLTIANGSFYLATDRGLAISTDNMQSFIVPLEKVKVNSVQINGLAVVTATDQGCFLATANNVFILLGNSQDCTKAIYQAKNIYLAQKNNLKICTENNFVWHDRYVYPNSIRDFVVLEDTVYVITDTGFFINGQLYKNFDYSRCLAIYLDNAKNIIWLATDKGLYKSGDRGKTWVVYDQTSGLTETNINSIFAENLNIYLGSDNGLIHSLNAGETWKTYKRNSGLISNKVLKVIAKK